MPEPRRAASAVRPLPHTAVDSLIPLQHQRMSQLIVDQIRSLVRTGQLRPGDRLPSERELCERFGVSRVTVREALRVLEAGGLITIRVGARGGAFITEPSRERVGEGVADLLTLSGITASEVTEARRVFELGILELVCERADDHDVADLLEICDRSDQALAHGGYTMDLSAEFHVRLGRATHNQAIEMLMQSFHGPLLMSLRQAQTVVPGLEQLGVVEHRQLVVAIAARDLTAATALLRRHLDRSGQALAQAERAASPAGVDVQAG